MHGSYAYSHYVLLPICWGLLLLVLAWYSWRQRSVAGAQSLAVACLLAACWAIGNALEMAAVDFTTAVAWIKFQSLMQLPAATAILAFVLQYAGFGRWLNRGAVHLLTLPSIIVTLLVLTNDTHHLIWTDFLPGASVRPVWGLLSWPLVLGGTVLGLVSMAVLLRLIIRPTAPERRRPAVMIACGLFMVRAIFVLDRGIGI